MEGELKKPGVPPLPQKPGGKKSHLEELEKAIYRRDRAIPKLRREDLYEHARTTPATGWKHEDGMSADEVHAVRSSFFTRLFLFSFAFFALAVGLGFYVIFGGGDTVSSKNLNISVVGPVSVAAGSPLELQVAVQNKNAAAIQNAALVVEYPDGTKDPLNSAKDLSYEKDVLGTIASGALVSHPVHALLYGETGSVSHLKITVQYNLAGSNTLFYADSGYDVTISSSPVSLAITALGEVTSGQQVDIAVDLVSNSNALLQNLVLKANFPFGFVAGNSAPQPAYGNSEWAIGDMKAGDKRKIHIIGVLNAQDGEARVFKFQVGTAGADGQTIGTAYLATEKSITVKKPFFGIATTLDGQDAQTYAAAPGGTVHAEMTWTNNTNSEIDNAVIVVKLNGPLYDRQSIVPHLGFYKSADNTIAWDNTTDPELTKIPAGMSGNVSFDFGTIPLSAPTGSVKQPQISFDVNVSGKRLGENSVQESVSSVDSRTIKISSNLNLISRMVYSVGPFKNAGHIPPKADNPVTYTVIWSITNTSNDVSDAKVTATLPSYVSWVGNSVPQAEKISFNPVNNQITWNAGAIPADAGVTKNAREVGFQVSFLPSASQVGTIPEIIGLTELDGNDTWSLAPLRITRNALNTRLTTDPNFLTGQDQVIK